MQYAAAPQGTRQEYGFRQYYGGRGYHVHQSNYRSQGGRDAKQNGSWRGGRGD